MLIVGAPNLGIGAILGALSSDVPLVVVQEIADPIRGIDWAAVAEAGDTVVLKNGPGRGFDSSFDVVTSVEQLERPASDRRLLIVEKLASAKGLVEAATSVTCSVGPGQESLVALLKKAKPKAAEVAVLVCENRLDVAAWSRLDAPWKICQVIVDRICTERAYSQKNDQIEVLCEKQCEITAPIWAAGVFKVGQSGLKLVPPEYIPFVSEKKARLVNSIQQVFALLAASAVRKRGVPHEKESVDESDQRVFALTNDCHCVGINISQNDLGQIRRNRTAEDGQAMGPGSGLSQSGV